MSDKLSDIDLDAKNSSISDLIRFLKSSFRVTDFDKVEQFLRLREEKFRVEREAMKLEFQRNSKELAKEMEKRNLEFEFTLKGLEDELEVSRNRCGELEERNKKAQVDSRVLWEKKGREAREAREDYVELESKFNELGVEKVAVEEELKKYKRKCEEFEVKVANLLEKTRKNEQEEKDKYLRLKRDDEKLERRDKVDYSKKFGEVETRVIHLKEEEEDSMLSSRDRHSGKKINLGPENVESRSQNKVNCGRRNEKSKTVKDEEIDEVIEEDHGNGFRNQSPIEVEGRSERKASSSAIIEILDSDEEMGPRKGSKRMRSSR